MKKPVKMSAFAGFCLFGVAALFSISLLLVLADVTGANPAAQTALYRMGKMFSSVYGLCSVLIPLFLVVAAIQCFSDTWTVRRGVLLAGSFLPFFTLDALEHAVRMLMASDSGAVLGIKLSAAVITCLLILAAEYLLLLLVSDLVESALMKEKIAKGNGPSDGIDVIGRDDEIPEDELYDESLLSEAPVASEEETEDVAEETGTLSASAPLPAEKPSETLVDGSANPFANFFGSPLPEPAAPASVSPEAAGEPTIEQAIAAEKAMEAVPAPAPLAAASVNSDSPASPAVTDNAAASPSSFEPTEPYQPVALTQPPVHEAPHYNENASPLPAAEDDEPSEMLELNSFDPEKDSFDGFVPHEEEVGSMEPVDDDIAAFENQNANDFDDDFYDIDLNADDDDADAAADEDTADDATTDDLDTEIDDYEQRLEREEAEQAAEASKNLAIAEEEQKATSLESIFADMEDDAAREVQSQALTDSHPQQAMAEHAAGESESFSEPIIDDSTIIDFADDGIFDDEPKMDDQEEAAGTGESAAGEEDFADPVFDDAEEAILDDSDNNSDEGAESRDEFEASPAYDETAAFDDSSLNESAGSMAFDDSDETILDDSEDFEEPEMPAEADDIPVVNPLAPPVVDANGIPYETAVSEEEVRSSQASALSAANRVPSAHDTLSVTVTAASPASPEQPERPRRRTFASYSIPTEGVLESYPTDNYQVIDEETRQAGEELKATLGEFKIEAEVTGIRKGPVVTMFEILPAPGVKLSKIVALQDNIALRLAASSVRIVAPIPGKHAVGIEVPNKERAIVGFKEIIEQDLPQFKKMAIPVVLGKDISGEAQLIDLAKTPHLLIAGSTGAGKSVCVNTMILSILYKRSPDQVKLIMIDPKVVELKLYNDIPHLLTPVITEPKKAFQSLQYCLCEMERRYALLDGMGVRDIVSYNNRIVERHIATEKLPYIVVIIDEFADLMATTGKELESTLARLAAMSRAVGIHLVLATQRPSIDVITGLIKANIPSRIAFMVASKMDSRIIIDQVGAEKLLGKGDMLYASATDPFPVRIQGTLVNDNEVERVVNCVKEYGEPDYIDDEIFVDDDDDGENSPGLFGDGEDPLYDQALEIVMQAGKASASYIQRRLKIGYNRAARLVEEMEERGIVGPANGSKAREVIHMV